MSIIATSYTEKRTTDLLDLLTSIQKQKYPNIETVIVIEQSEKLFQMVSSFVQTSKISNIRITFESQKLGIANARNLGIKTSSGAFISFVDDDAVLFDHWAEEVVKTFLTHPEAIGVVGPAVPLWADPSMCWFPQEFYWIIGCTDRSVEEKLKEVPYAWGVNMSFRREAFDVYMFPDIFSAGAHDEGKVGLIGDDTELSLNLKKRTGRCILCNPKSKVWHKVPKFKIGLKYARRYAFWQGYGEVVFKKNYEDASQRFEKENSYLRRTTTGLVLRVMRSFNKRPVDAIKTASLGFVVFTWILLGYLSCVFPKFYALTRYFL